MIENQKILKEADDHTEVNDSELGKTRAMEGDWDEALEYEMFSQRNLHLKIFFCIKLNESVLSGMCENMRILWPSALTRLHGLSVLCTGIHLSVELKVFLICIFYINDENGQKLLRQEIHTTTKFGWKDLLFENNTLAVLRSVRHWSVTGTIKTWYNFNLLHGFWTICLFSSKQCEEESQEL